MTKRLVTVFVWMPHLHSHEVFVVNDADSLLSDMQRFLDDENKRWGSKGDQAQRVIGLHTKSHPVINVSNSTWDGIVKQECVMLDFVSQGGSQSKQQVIVLCCCLHFLCPWHAVRAILRCSATLLLRACTARQGPTDPLPLWCVTCQNKT